MHSLSVGISNYSDANVAKLKQNSIKNFGFYAIERTTIETGKFAKQTKEADKAMSDLNRGIMKFEGADSPKVVTISTVLLLGSIVALIIWALQVAYAVN